MPANLAFPPADQTHPFLSNVAEIRRRARKHIEEGAVSAGHAADRKAVVRLLNAALATELVCVLRYRRYSVMDAHTVADSLRNEFMKRAREEQSRADQITARIIELGGEPNPDPPGGFERSGGEFADDEALTDMLAEDLIAERIAIDTYREIIRYVGDNDATTRQLFESIVTIEQQHAAGLASMRDTMRRQERAAVGAHPGSHAVDELR
jgi:bacterioferritin